MAWESWQRLEPHSNTLYSVIATFPPAIFFFLKLTVKRIPAICFGLLWFFRSIVWNVLSPLPLLLSHFLPALEIPLIFLIILRCTTPFSELPWRMREDFCEFGFVFVTYVVPPSCFCVEQGGHGGGMWKGRGNFRTQRHNVYSQWDWTGKRDVRESVCE